MVKYRKKNTLWLGLENISKRAREKIIKINKMTQSYELKFGFSQLIRLRLVVENTFWQSA